MSPGQVTTCCAVLKRSIRVRVCFRGKPVVPWNAGQSFVQTSLFGRRHVVARGLQGNDRESDQGPAALLDLFASHCDQAVEEFREPNGMRIIRHRIGSTSACRRGGTAGRKFVQRHFRQLCGRRWAAVRFDRRVLVDDIRLQAGKSGNCRSYGPSLHLIPL